MLGTFLMAHTLNALVDFYGAQLVRRAMARHKRHVSSCTAEEAYRFADLSDLSRYLGTETASQQLIRIIEAMHRRERPGAPHPLTPTPLPVTVTIP